MMNAERIDGEKRRKMDDDEDEEIWKEIPLKKSQKYK
jgi:hypothetical protein